MGISSFFSSLFGKAKVTVDETMIKASDIAEDVKENIETFTESASKKMEEMHLSEKVNDMVATAKDKLEDATEWAEEKAHQAKDAVEDLVEKAESKFEDLAGKNDEKVKTEE